MSRIVVPLPLDWCQYCDSIRLTTEKLYTNYSSSIISHKCENEQMCLNMEKDRKKYELAKKDAPLMEGGLNCE